MSANQFMRHKKARQTLNGIFEQADKHSVVHYSCESFYDRKDGTLPRITSVAIRNLDSVQTISFSIHEIAELDKITFDNIDNCYNDLERRMLDCLALYLKNHSGRTLLQWNMRDRSYGFPAIEHRHRLLGGEPYVVADDRKIDLSRLFVSLYGVSYIGHPRLKKLLEKNGIEARDFLNGAQEAEAFNERKMPYER